MEAAQSAEHIYRYIYGIPRHDPRVEGMTEEEFEFELMVRREILGAISGKGVTRPVDPEWAEWAQEQLRQEREATGTTDPLAVDPEQVFGERG